MAKAHTKDVIVYGVPLPMLNRIMVWHSARITARCEAAGVQVTRYTITQQDALLEALKLADRVIRGEVPMEEVEDDR